MILVDWQIRKDIEDKHIGISPFSEELLNPSSLDVRLGNKFGVVKAQYEHIDPLDPYSFHTEEIESDSWILGPGGSVLGVLLEEISLPDDTSAYLKGKSSLGRLFLDNSSFACWIDPGWAGSLVIELANHSSNSIILTAGMKIGQLVFERHEVVDTPYGEKKTSKYHNQSGMTGSKGIS